MNKPLFYTGLGFYALEFLVGGLFLLTQISIDKEVLGIITFGLINLLFALFMLLGALKD